MKDALRKVFGVLLRPLEKDESEFIYKPSHRTILAVVSVLFLFLASLSLFLAPAGQWDYYIPVVVFGGAGIYGLIVAGLGKDIAVARLWGSKGK